MPRARLALLLAAALLSSCGAPPNPAGNAPPSAVPAAAQKPADPPGMVRAADAPAEALYEFVAVDFVDEKTGWVAGRDQEQNVSAVFRTTDGGATWEQAVEFSPGLIQDIDFASPTAGWFVTAEGGIYASRDGGASWVPERESDGAWTLQREGPVKIISDAASGAAGITAENVASVFFLDERTGWAAGDAPGGPSIADLRGLLLATRDGGATWAELKGPSGEGVPFALNDVWFLGPKRGWAAGGSLENADEIDVLLRTADGGVTWDRVRTGAGQYHRAVQFASPERGWVVGITFDTDTGEYGPSKIVGTADGGATWAPQLTLDRSLFDLVFVDEKTGWAVGDYGAIFATADGGTTWRQQTSFAAATSRRMFASPPEIPKRAGAETLTGAERDAATEPRSHSTLFFLSPEAGWAAGSRAILRRRPRGA